MEPMTLRSSGSGMRSDRGVASSLDTLGTPVLTQSTATVGNTTLAFSYAGVAGLSASVTYVLTGGNPGSGTSDILERISLHNSTAGNMGLHFYEYSNFQLGGVGNNVPNYLTFTDSNDVEQTALVNGGSMSLVESVTADTGIIPTPNEWQGAAFPTLLNSLNSGGAVTLSSTPSLGTQIGPGNMSWAYEWDPTLSPGQTFTITKDKNIAQSPAPEPGTLALLGASSAILLRRVWRRRRLSSLP